MERDAENDITDKMKIETFNYIKSSPVQAKFCQSFKISVNSEWSIWSKPDVGSTAWGAPAFQSNRVQQQQVEGKCGAEWGQRIW